MKASQIWKGYTLLLLCFIVGIILGIVFAVCSHKNRSDDSSLGRQELLPAFKTQVKQDRMQLQPVTSSPIPILSENPPVGNSYNEFRNNFTKLKDSDTTP